MARTSITIPGDLRQHYTQHRDVIYSQDMEALIGIGYLLASLDPAYRTACQVKTIKVAAPTKPAHTSRDISYGLRAHKYITDQLGDDATPETIAESVKDWHAIHTTAKAKATTMLASQQLKQYAKEEKAKAKEAKPADAQTLSTKERKTRAEGDDISLRIPKVSRLHYLAYRWLVEVCQKSGGNGIGIDRRTDTLRTMHSIAQEQPEEIARLQEEALTDYAFDSDNETHREILSQDWAVRVRKTLSLSKAETADAVLALVIDHPEIRTFTPAPPKRKGTRRTKTK